MGLFDSVRCSGAAFVCSEGHPLEGDEFQTYDLGRTMGNWTLGERLSGASGGAAWPEDEPSRPFSGTVAVATTCRKCPVFWDPATGNVVELLVDFEVQIAADVVGDVRRISPSLREWIATADSAWRGPVSADEASRLHHAAREASAKAVTDAPRPSRQPDSGARS